jgi:prolycopene isomerase
MRTYDTIFVGPGFGRVARVRTTAKKGKNVLVVDKGGDIPGPYAIILRRKDFDFDVPLYFFGGTVSGANHFKMIKDRGAADKVKFLPNKSLCRHRCGDNDFKAGHGYLADHKEQLFCFFLDEVDNITWLFVGSDKNYHDARGFRYSREPFRPGLAATSRVSIHFELLLSRIHHDLRSDG